MSILEPIEEKDLDLKNKLVEKAVEALPNDKAAPEVAPIQEVAVERKEGAMEKDEAYSKILSKVKTTLPVDDSAVPTDAQKTSLNDSEESKVEKLIQLAMQKGVVHAVKVARHMEDNYVLDEFHDRLLAEELHDALVQKGLIEEL